VSEKQLWRVVLDDGTVRVVFAEGGKAWLAPSPRECVYSDDTEREAVMMLASRLRWPVVEVVAPGEESRAQIAAHLTAMREDYARLLAATHAYLTASHRESGEATARAALVEESGWSTCPCEGCALGGECEAEANSDA